MEPYLEGEVRSLFDRWHAGLVARHAGNLTFQEIRKGVQALSRSYVQARAGLEAGGALEGTGKRAAFALFFAPLHFLTVYHAVREIDLHKIPCKRIWDLGCGTGAAGAAWAAALGETMPAGGAEAPSEYAGGPKVLGLDRAGFVLSEARETYRAFALKGEARRVSLDRDPPRGRGAAVLAYTLNEMSDSARERMLRHVRGDALRPLLIVEPVAKRAASWWPRWERSLDQDALALHALEWRRRLELPEWIAEMDRAAGLDHGELTARVLGVVG